MKLPEPREAVDRPIYLRYRYRASEQANRFLHAIKKGKILGVRSVGTGKVLVPPPGVCAESGTLTPQDLIELPDRGTVLSFTIVHLPIPNSRLKPPFVVANILLDGADQAFSHIISEAELKRVVIGTRVRAHWKPEAEWDYGLENIEYFVLTDEPAVDIEQHRALRLEEAARHA
ncbi:MAG TPA: hypothetical protein DIW43_19130 [Spongiibacteraceae bacterium]|nr:hypothetical protein [Spongiibacteraceae bacterium]MBN51776.1 hypothetical protein [Spongiibacteraceae bacterium]HCS29576.1 hypothetical protein [Spongiibacteraceae bacterium]|tara:strand:- start:203 stop:724 length:522 start_codon:yes stop_codon:yes gene_type:complete